MNETKQATGILRGLKVLDIFHDIDPDISAGTIMCFLMVCAEDGISNSTIEKELGFHKARVSRNIQLLCTVARRRLSQEGMNLVDMKIDPKDFRKRTLHLTSRGKLVRDKLVRLLG